MMFRKLSKNRIATVYITHVLGLKAWRNCRRHNTNPIGIESNVENVEASRSLAAVFVSRKIAENVTIVASSAELCSVTNEISI